jgi:hypothetical protein
MPTNIPWMFLFLAAVTVHTAGELLADLLFRLPNRIIRAGNIRAQGWPPPHCDGDGDVLETQDTKSSEASHNPERGLDSPASNAK